MEAQRVQLGDEIPFVFQTKNSGGVPTAPDDAPTITVYNSAGTRIVNAKAIPPVDRRVVTGLFGYSLFLGPQFSVGAYTVLFSWTIGAFIGKLAERFEIMPGGDPAGAVISMTEFVRPHATFIVKHLTSGILSAGRNPRL